MARIVVFNAKKVDGKLNIEYKIVRGDISFVLKDEVKKSIEVWNPLTSDLSVIRANEVLTLTCFEISEEDAEVIRELVKNNLCSIRETDCKIEIKLSTYVIIYDVKTINGKYEYQGLKVIVPYVSGLQLDVIRDLLKSYFA